MYSNPVCLQEGALVFDSPAETGLQTSYPTGNGDILRRPVPS